MSATFRAVAGGKTRLACTGGGSIRYPILGGVATGNPPNTQERDRHAITSIDLRQRPSESFARLTRRGGRDFDASTLVLTDHLWARPFRSTGARSAEREYLLDVWLHVLADIAAAEASAARTALAS